MSLRQEPEKRRSDVSTLVARLILGNQPALFPEHRKMETAVRTTSGCAFPLPQRDQGTADTLDPPDAIEIDSPSGLILCFHDTPAREHPIYT
jgi:hypothetical protein